MAEVTINLGRRSRKRKRIETPEWLVTYGDMTTLLLAFFIILFTFATVDGHEIRLILSAFPGLGTLSGGNTLEEGVLPELGSIVLSLPANTRNRQLDEARVSLRTQTLGQLQTKNVVFREEERGLVVSLAADLYYPPASAELNIDEARDVLQNIAAVLGSNEYAGRTIRIEGHTDSIPADPVDGWESNWDLSAARAINVLRYLADYGVNETHLQIMGLANTQPIADNNTVQGRAANRRVDIVILNEGHN